jgi:hypothetical protein
MADLSLADSLIVHDEKTGVISFNHGGADPAIVRARIRKLTTDLLALPSEDKREFEVKHTFLNGMYMRELFIPKGSLLVGKVHKLDCINIVSKGDISILTENGSARVTAGHSTVSPAGVQKVGFANEDTVFINVFRTDETDPERVEDVVAWDSYEAFDRLAYQPEALVIKEE